MYSASAIRDYQYLQTMPTMRSLRAEERRQELDLYFPEIARLPGVPYRSRYCSLKTGKIAAQDPLHDFLSRHLPRKLVWTKEERNRRVDEYLDRETPEITSSLVDKLARALLAFSAGAALVVPMLIMALKPSGNKSLITTTVSVILFATALSLGIRTTNENKFVATATYAAVLIVFVGTSGS